MKKLAIVLFIFPLIIAACKNKSQGPEAEKKNIIETYELYREAIRKGETEKISSFLSKSSFDFFEQIRDMALNADSAKVAALSFSNKLTVLLIRATNSAEGLKAMDKESFLKSTLGNSGASSQLDGIKLGEIKLDGDKAAVDITTMGQEVPGALQFIKEEGKWKLDVASMISVADKLIASSPVQMSTDLFLNMALNAAAPGINHQKLWQPLNQQLP